MPGGKAIIGYSGFVGSNLLQFYKFDHFYNSQNLADAANQSFDELYLCCIPSVKWRAIKYPQEDADTIENIQTILETITAKRVILISTIDVYDDVDRKYDEDYDCDWLHNHAYGRNRYFFERFVMKTFENHHIVRLPALFGKGLKKNVIYDLLHTNQIANIPRNSMFQWYDLNWLGPDIDLILKNGLRICNLFTEPLPTHEILDLFDHHRDSYNQNNIPIVYNSKTRHSDLFDCDVPGYIRTRSEVLCSIIKFILFDKINKSRLSVSNICVDRDTQFQFACLLRLYGILRVQIAPTTLLADADWSKIGDLDLTTFTNQGITVQSFQSITFGKPNLNIFSKDTRDQLMEHLKFVAKTASDHRVRFLVFGCPRNRQVLPEIEDPDSVFVEFFQDLGNYCADLNIIVCIEPNAKEYGCNYLNTIEEVGRIVTRIDRPSIRMMVDIGNIIMEQDDITKIIDYKNPIYNVDIAQPRMCSFVDPQKQHIKFRELINKHVDTNRTLEMLAIKDLRDLNKSLENFISLYGH